MARSLVQSWKDSCLLYKPGNLKLFVLVTLNNLLRGLGVVKMAMLLMLVITIVRASTSPGPLLEGWTVVFSFFHFKSLLSDIIAKYMYPGATDISFLLSLVWLVTTFLVVGLRASVERKSRIYLLQYFIRYFMLFFVAQELILMLPLLAYRFLEGENSGWGFVQTVQSSCRAVLYHLPVVAGLQFFFIAMLMIGKIITKECIVLGLPLVISHALAPCVWYIFSLGFFLSAWSVYYTKIKHGDRALLFDEV